MNKRFRSRPEPHAPVSNGSASGAGLFLVLLGLLLAVLRAPGPVQAQERADDARQSPDLPPDVRAIHESPRGAAPEVPEALWARLSPREQAVLRARRAEGRSAQSPRRKAIGGRPEIEPTQSFAITPNPTPKLNLGRFFSSTLRRAGDINGDGTEDYLYNARARFAGIVTQNLARDERTPELEDRTGKTVVYFGGTPEEGEDQFFYRSLRPVGDINGDGFADAVAFDLEEGSVRLYVGSPSGYQDTGVTKPLDLEFSVDGLFRVVRGFTDLDGDGLDDVLIGKGLGSPEIEILFGASSAEDTETQRYDVEGGFFVESAYNTADLSGEGSGRIVRLFGGDPVSVRVYSVDATRSLETIQSFGAEELENEADDYELSLIDLTGDGAREAVASDFSDAYAFSDTTEADGVVYGTAPTPLTGPVVESPGTLVPIGDLDGDGRHDFLASDAGDAQYVSYGPPELSDELTFDTELPADPGTELDARFIPTGSFGDVTGNGRSDLILELIDDSADEIGHRFASIASSREIESSVDVRVPHGHVFDSIWESTKLGDVNGDGIGDFAVARTDLDQVEVYYGGASIPEEPARTLQVPSDTLAPVSVGAGDVTGDGAPDIVVGYEAGERIDVYEAGGPLSSTPDQTVRAADAGVAALRQPRVVGDVSGDGVADLLISNQGDFDFGDIPERLFLLFGGSSLPTQPDRMIEYADSSGSRHVPVALGDVSGEGTADFAVGRPDFEAPEEAAKGRVDVYFGESSSFDTPDVTLRPANVEQGIQDYGGAIASGDFNGDGTQDLATRPASVDPSGPTESVRVSIYDGGTGFDDEADRRLQVPTAPLQPSVSSSGRGGVDQNEDGLADAQIRGAMERVSVPGSDADALLLASNTDGAAANALLYQPPVSTGPTRVLEAPNQDTDLGGEGQNVAVGEMTGDQAPDAVLVQHGDNNDAAVSSRFYRYSLEGFPVAARSLPVDTSGTLDFGDSTGVDLRFSGVSGAGQVTVQKYDDGPDGTGGIEEANVSSYRFAIGAEPSLSFDSTEIQLAVGTLDGIGDPSAVTLYKRPDVGTGEFDSLETRVGTAGTSGDLSDDTLYAQVESFSEFVLASDSEPLPVELSDFGAQADEGTVHLTWQTASETGSARFEVQRRTSEEDAWTRVGSVQGSGTTTEVQTYRFTDTELPYDADQLTYRLRQVDTDGATALSAPVTVERRVREVKLLGTFPNPASQQATVRYALPERQDVSLRLYDMLGRQVRTLVEGEQKGRHEQQVKLSGLSSGIYFLQLEAEGQTRTQKVTVVR